MKRKAALILCLVSGMAFGGCGAEAKTDGYEHLIGISLTNVMEPWLSNLAQVVSDKGEEDGNVNLILRDAAGSTEKQIQDIEFFMECGIDLLILSPDGSDDLNAVMEKVFREIPVVVVGVEPSTESYTTVIQADDHGIGKMAGEYILENLYRSGDTIAVIEGVKNSPISSRRLEGFQEAMDGHVPQEQITYCYGDWLRDSAELRIKDFLVGNNQADIIFAFNDEMAYGAYQACQQLRVKDVRGLIGVDGFEGETAGMNMVDRGVLDATIQTPDFGELAFDTALDILDGKEIQRNIIIVPKMIS